MSFVINRSDDIISVSNCVLLKDYFVVNYGDIVSVTNRIFSENRLHLHYVKRNLLLIILIRGRVFFFPQSKEHITDLDI